MNRNEGKLVVMRAHNTLEHSLSDGDRRRALRPAQRGQRPMVAAEADEDNLTGKALTRREANLFRLLAHPARLELLGALREDAACVCHLEALLGYPQAYVSQQLAVLRAAGLIEGRREGWNVYYRVCDARLFVALDAALTLLSPMGLPAPLPQTRREPGSVVPGCACPHCASVTPDSVDKQEAL